MARKEARISTGVWRNRQFTDLPLAAQGLYWMLLAQPDVSMCGVLPYLPGRWAALCGSDDTADMLALLEESGQVVVDRDTSELLIRTFVKHDGVLRGPKTRAGMWKAWSGVLSDRLRAVVLHQAGEWVDEAVEKGWTDRATVDACPTPPTSDTPSDTPPDTPSGQVGDPPSDTPGHGAGTSDLQPPTTNPRAADASQEGLPAAIVTACGMDYPAPDTAAHRQLLAASADLGRQGAMPHEVPQRARAYRERWPDATMTPHALAKHWPQLVLQRESRHDPGRNDSAAAMAAAGLETA